MCPAPCISSCCPQCEYGYKPTAHVLPKGEDLPRLYSSTPDTATMVTRAKQQLLQPSPVLHLRLLVRILLRHGGLLQQQPSQQPPGGMAAAARKGAAAAGAAGGAAGSSSGGGGGGLDAVDVSDLTHCVVDVIGSSKLSVKSSDGSQTAYPVVVLQQAFPKVFGFEPPLNFLGLENFKQLLQVGAPALTAVAGCVVCCVQSLELFLSFGFWHADRCAPHTSKGACADCAPLRRLRRPAALTDHRPIVAPLDAAAPDAALVLLHTRLLLTRRS